MNLMENTIRKKIKNDVAVRIIAKMILLSLQIGEFFLKGIKFDNRKIQRSYDILNNYSAQPKNCAPIENLPIDKSIDLSIVIPVYNCENFISDCIDSILNQKTKYNVQVIIINDGSTDSTEQILMKYQDVESVIIHTQKNKGFSGARNVGINKSIGKYIMFVDADDYLLEGSIENLMDIAETRNADIVQGEYINVSMVGERITSSKICDSVKDTSKKCTTFELPGYPWAKVYRRELFDQIRFPEHFWFEDSIISHIVFPKATSIYAIPNKVYAYRINENGITQTFKGKHKSIDAVWILDEIYKYSLKNHIDINAEWIDYFSDKITERTYDRLHDLPIKIQKEAYHIVVNEFKKFVDCMEDELDLKNPQINAIVNNNFYLWKIICLKSRWGIK